VIAKGPFDVTLTPESPGADGVLGRLALDKTFHGDLDALSKGTMLSFRTSVDGSAGCVAMEHVTGMLAGRRGTFVLQHSGTMDRGAPRLVVTVVPDSGTGDLVGLSGAMSIEIAGGKHTYAFEYSLPNPPSQGMHR
jgi:hypothetical protein